MVGKDYDRWKQNEDGTWSRKLNTTAEMGVKATAGAIALAEANGIDLMMVTGTGKDGQIVKADVEALV